MCIKGKNAFYMDPFGMSPPEAVKKWVKSKGLKGMHTTDQLQDLDSQACGYFCLYFLKEMQQKTIFEFLAQFSIDTVKNEGIIGRFFGFRVYPHQDGGAMPAGFNNCPTDVQKVLF